ncbi:DUF2971 domain-containing protein [Tolumonas lignilytica]|nr:DUF2971 domain-containing protein [Tolumonas lignilytica]
MNLYKYQSIDPSVPPAKNKSIQNLFEATVVFSARQNFNDLFDSKVNFIIPRRERLRKFRGSLSKSQREVFDSFTPGNTDFFQKLKQQTNTLIDSYYFYCLTTNPLNNLMWSHYANSHHGFCIEWDADKMNADKVIYSEQIASIDLLDITRSNMGLISQEKMGDDLWAALRTKLDYWSYENEYRVKLSHEMKQLVTFKDNKISVTKADSTWIKSIIFGVRCPVNVVTYVAENIPFRVNFKKCKIINSELYITP